jgi:hypothetical protein
MAKKVKEQPLDFADYLSETEMKRLENVIKRFRVTEILYEATKP